jgi:RNA polymerase sigma-70 factor (ECF subfamily)
MQLAAPGLAESLLVEGEALNAELELRFREFVKEHRDRAIGLAWRLLGRDAQAAEDVAQEAFVRAYRALPGFRADAQLSTWFYRILVNEVRRHQRWLGVRRRFAGEMPADPPAEREASSDPALQQRIQTAVASLPRGQREVFVLVHLEGFSLREAAELTGRALGTMKSHVHRALRTLREELVDLYEESKEATE